MKQTIGKLLQEARIKAAKEILNKTLQCPEAVEQFDTVINDPTYERRQLFGTGFVVGAMATMNSIESGFVKSIEVVEGEDVLDALVEAVMELNQKRMKVKTPSKPQNN